jgi:hypothetical protein
MPTGNYLQDKGYDAAVAITKGRAVKFSAVETVTPVTAATDLVVGIAVHSVTAGEILQGKGAVVRRAGAAVMEASEAITVGAEVSLTAAGKAAVSAAAERVIGICDEAAGADGEYIRITLSLPGYIKA